MRTKIEMVVPGITVLDGTAELIPLPGHDVDALVVGEAFHWFETTAATRVIRVIRVALRELLATDRVRLIPDRNGPSADDPRDSRALSSPGYPIRRGQSCWNERDTSEKCWPDIEPTAILPGGFAVATDAPGITRHGSEAGRWRGDRQAE